MRKITEQSVSAFLTATAFSKDNTVVRVEPNVTVLELHGNPIAYLYNDLDKTLSITNAGWFSNTTKERLNGIPNVSINQVKGVWYLNGKEWNGDTVDVRNGTDWIYLSELVSLTINNN